jgi:elongation factor Ts
MAEITASMVNDLRQKTGAGMMDCKKALGESAGDVDKAIEWLRKKGMASADKKSARATAEGLVHSYIHAGGKIGVLVEVNCETDFAARNETFQEFVKNVAMHIAASAPTWIRKEDVPPDALVREKEVLAAQVAEENKAKPKPANVVEKIVEGKLSKFYSNVCLLEQPYVKDPDQTVEAYLKSAVAKIGENIRVRRFVRYQLGEALAGETKTA